MRDRVRGWIRRGAVCGAIVVAVSGCRSDATVLVEANAKGAGRVRVEVALDKDAARGLGDVRTALATDDLAARGWAVEGPRLATDGTAAFALERSFRSVSEANSILDELTGATGPFHGVRLRRTTSALSTGVSLRGSVDLTKGLEVLGDARLAELTGSPSLLGFDVAEAAAVQGEPIEKLVSVKLHATLPNSAARTWQLPLGRTTSVAMVGSTREWSVPIGAGATLVGLIGIALGTRLIRRTRSTPEVVTTLP